MSESREARGSSGGRGEGEEIAQERPLLEHFERAGCGLPPWIRVGPGDDMAEIKLDSRVIQLAVDQVIEGRHFIRGTPESQIAWKALARNLSDVAAMAVRPKAILAACTLPADWAKARAAALFEALRQAALEWECPLIGGDLAMHGGREPLHLAVTILAEPWPEWRDQPAITRRGAREGDGLFVTGALGGSFRPDGFGRHLAFEPRVFEARELRRHLGDRLHAMIDLSDGLGRDAAALAPEDGQVRLFADQVPCAESCSLMNALSDGEDYELCFAAAGEVPPSLSDRFGRPVPITRIGVLQRRAPGEARCVIDIDGTLVDASNLGWEHTGRSESAHDGP